MLKIENVCDLIGLPFEDTRNGKSWGCLAPMYQVIPETQKHLFTLDNYNDIQKLFEKYCKQVDLKDIRYGDILLLRLPRNRWHVMVVIDSGKVLHCSRDGGTELVSLERYKKYVKGVYRYVSSI